MKKTKLIPSKTVFQVLLRSERETRAWSMREASEQAGLVNAQTWEAYENGRREPTISQANKLLSAFGLRVLYG